MTDENPRRTLGIVFCSSLVVYLSVVIAFSPLFVPVIGQRDELALALFQSVFAYLLLFGLFMLPTSYVYWNRRIQVKVLGPKPAAVEPGEELSLTVVTGLPSNEPHKGATLEAFLGALPIVTEKLEGSPMKLSFIVPEVSPGYHKVSVRVSKDGYFAGTSQYELLVTPLEVSKLITNVKDSHHGV